MKDLWYQLRVLRPIYPEQLDALAAELKTLCEYLGDDHDLLMLQQSVADEGAPQLELLEPGVLSGMIEQPRRELQAKALKVSEQLFTEKPADFCGRLARYWKAWRDGERRPRNSYKAADQAPRG